MEKIYQDLPVNERKDHLTGIADEVIEGFYYSVPLSADELVDMQQEYTDNAIGLSELDAKMKNEMAAYKAKIKAIKNQMAALIKLLKTKAIERCDTVYKVVDESEGIVKFFNPEGICVSVRRILESEKQSTIFRMRKTS